MKKHFIFAVAALAASVACTKTNIDTDQLPDQKISFEVANYVPQTKAETSLATGEGFYEFHTTATQFPGIGTAITFMNNVAVKAWDNATTPVVVTSGDVYTWAPEQDYYWPKTGYINFYSYAGTKSPTTTVSEDKKTVTFNYGTVTVASDDNILVADAALHFNANTATYRKDYVASGVPTLFRHQLAKVKFTVHLKTTQSASSNTTWKVKTLGSETISGTTYESAVTFVKNGSLQLSNADELAATATVNTTTQGWTAVVGESANVDGWIAGTEDSDKEKVTLTSQTLTIATNATESTNTENLVEERTVMPQATSNTKFVLYYEVSASHDNFSTTFLKEIRSVGVDVEKTLADLVSTITNWNKNTKVTYNIIIDPVSEKVTFDPAVEEWGSAEGSINVPLS